MPYSKKSVKKSVKKTKTFNSNKGSKHKSNKPKPLKGGFYKNDGTPERGLFDSLKVNIDSSAKPRNDPPDFPNCCIS
jgi:hypothetical protein